MGRLRGVPVPKNFKLLRVDLKDFFMSGTIEDLPQLAASIIEDDGLRSLVCDAIALLLKFQFVESKFAPGRAWAVRRGNGMGLCHSSAVCDAAL